MPKFSILFFATKKFSNFSPTFSSMLANTTNWPIKNARIWGNQICECGCPVAMKIVQQEQLAGKRQRKAKSRDAKKDHNIFTQPKKASNLSMF
jgi:hypothetical protein